jgi:hypothetical protein
MSVFSSNENKGMLWQLLYEQGAFNNISNNYINNIKNEFDQIVNVINTKKNLDLTNKNKLVLTEIVERLKKYKENSKHISTPLEEIKIKMDKDLKEKEKEFIELIKRPSPAEIDFTEKIDEPIKESNLNSVLNKMIAEREIEINSIIPPPVEKKNINNEGNDKNDDIKGISREKENIKMLTSNEINANNEEIKPVKKLTNNFFKSLSKSNNINNNNNKIVTFNEEDEYENDRDNSQIVYTNNDIMELLQKVLTNQDIILRNQKSIIEKILIIK